MRRLMRWSLVAMIVLAWLCVSSAARAAPNTQADGDAYEANNSFGRATPIAATGMTQATILPRGDVDWYAFEVGEQGELELVVSNVAPELDVNVRVWNANRDALTNWFAPLTKGGNTAAVVDLPAAGRYYLEVGDGNSDAEADQAYSLAIAFTASPDQAEPNNSFGTAEALALGQGMQATILPQGDVDWYVVEAQHPGELALAISDVPAELDVNVRVWNANRDALTNWFAPLAKGGNTEATIDLPAAGRYYVEVGDGNSDGRNVKPYTIRADLTPAADLFEPNNSFGSAAALALGEAVKATILPAGDADWFVVDVPHHGELKVQAGEVAPGLAVSLRVWNANRDAITNWFAPLTPGGVTDAVVDLPAAGRYYLEVAAESGQRAIQPFTLQADFAPAVDGLEPNNSFGSAAQFGATRSLQANILPANDADWLYFDVDHQGQLGVTIRNVAPEMAISVRAWNANRDTISNWFSPLVKGGDTHALVDLAAPGRYYLEVAAESGQRSIQPYTLETRFEVTADAGEPNDSYETATTAQLDATLAANILPANDHDWYSFEVGTPGDLHVFVTNVAPEAAIRFRVWDSAESAITNWYGPLAQGANTEAIVPIGVAGTYYLEVMDGSSSARSIQPYLLRMSMGVIDPGTMIAPVKPATQTGGTVAGAMTVTTTGAVTDTATTPAAGKVVILTSGQAGPIGAEIFVDEPGKPELDGARLEIPPDSVDAVHTVDIGATTAAPVASPFGLQPAGQYWVFAPEGLDFKQPVSITLPVPTGAAGPKMFIGHWNGTEWEDLGGTVENGLITAQTDGFSTYGVFCGSLDEYQQVRFENASSSPTVNILYVAGPSPDPENPELEMVAGCPPSDPQPPAWGVARGEGVPMLLRPGRYHFAVSYPQPQPGVTNSLWVTIPAGGGEQTIRIEDGGAVTDDANTQIDFAGNQAVESSNQRPILACDATVPAGVTLTNLDPAAAGLPSRVVQVGDMKLEQLPPAGEGVGFRAVATDPEGSPVSTYWTVTGPFGGTTAGEPAASGAPIGDQYTFQASVAGNYTVFLTVYDQFGLFDECRWILNVEPNNRPQIKVVSGRTSVEFGRLDEVRDQGAGPILPAAATLRPGVAAPVTVPGRQAGSAAVAWSRLTLCPTAIAGPFAVLPDVNAFLSAPAPVDALRPPAADDVTNRWQFPGRTCVWALAADADGDAQSVAFELPGPIFGSGTFFAATEVPAGFDPALPDGIALGEFIRTTEQLDSYNAWVSALYNVAGVPPAIVWEGWDDPCPPGTGNVGNPCATAISRGGVENIVAQTSDGFELPPQVGSTPIAVGPEAFGLECQGVFFISSLTPVPSDPGPGEGVVVTARLSPLAEACMVELSVVGTDGFNNQQGIPSNKSGEASLFIPGGAEGVTDVVTAQVCVPVLAGTSVAAEAMCTTAGGEAGTLIRMEVTYAF